MRKYYWGLFTLLAMIGFGNSALAQTETISIVFGKGMHSDDVRKVVVLSAPSGPTGELKPDADQYTYHAVKGSNLRFEVAPRKGYVVFVWKKANKGNERKEEFPESYSNTSIEIERVENSIEIEADICRLIPVVFTTEEEGSDGKEVNVEEQGEFGRAIAPEKDGKTYMLPENRGAYFDPKTKEGYNILCWSFGEGLRFPSRPDQFYKQNVPEDFYLHTRFYKDGETRTVTFTQPLTAVLSCFNQGETGGPEIGTGAKVTPGDPILFQVAPPDNPSGKVSLHHWEINGREYVDRKGEYYIDNSLSWPADEDLNVKVVPMAEYTSTENIARQTQFEYSYLAASQKIVVRTSSEQSIELLDISGKSIATVYPQAGSAEISASNLPEGTYLLAQGRCVGKLMIK